MTVKWWAVQAVQGCVAVCCPCCSIVPAHFLLQRSVCLVSLWIVPCACRLSTFGDAQQRPGKHHTLGHKCEHMQRVCATNTQQCPRGICPKLITWMGMIPSAPIWWCWCVRWPSVRLSSNQGIVHDFWHKGVTQKRYERRVKKLWQSWVWHSQKLPHQHQQLCPGHTEHHSWGYCRCPCPVGQDSSALDNAYLQHASL